MKIVVDSYIPYMQGVLDRVAEVVYLPYKEMTSKAVRDADALIVRTRTRCDEKLLADSCVKFIASATIGYDHIDAEFCRRHNIRWTNAPGCNALSVVQYISSALSLLALRNHFDLKDKTIGVVGVGAVGSKVAELAECLGMRVLLNDPPRARREQNNSFVSLKQICREADIITFHALLSISGKDKTYYLANENFFNALKRKPAIINAARGELVETKTLLNAIDSGKVSDVVLDCWESEPDIDLRLLEKTLLATPHIAGYSADGKANAATYSVQAVSKFFSLGMDHWAVTDLPAPYALDFSETVDVQDFFVRTYNIEADSMRLKTQPELFELLRSNYPFRREPKAYLPAMTESFRNYFEKQFAVFK